MRSGLVLSQLAIKSTQYKKLVPNDLQFTYRNLKSCKSNEKNETKNIRLLFFSFSTLNLIILMLFVSFDHVVFKISNIDMWTIKYLVQASYTELPLSVQMAAPFMYSYLQYLGYVILVGRRISNNSDKLFYI